MTEGAGGEVVGVDGVDDCDTAAAEVGVTGAAVVGGRVVDVVVRTVRAFAADCG